jgi:hypothetical protein
MLILRLQKQPCHPERREALLFSSLSVALPVLLVSLLQN